MITDKLKTILGTAGCTLIIYESSQLANLKTDLSNEDSIVGIILQPETITLEVKANAIQEHYPPVMIEILKQTDLERSADENEAILSSLLDICKAVILALIDDGTFKKITSVKLSKVLENKYDANLIGWAIPLDLIELKNENKC